MIFIQKLKSKSDKLVRFKQPATFAMGNYLKNDNEFGVVRKY
jgi:hypothetical protein